jgi:hypothetical protein
MYGDDKGPKVWAAVKNCLRDLFEEYRVKYAPNIACAQASFALEAESSGGRASMMKSLIAKKMRLNNGASSSSNKSEIDKFLTEEPKDDGPKFDILAWWKGNSTRFPILACLARDVLAIPFSTVAFESAFSTGGRVLDDFRTSLTPFMVEALVCTQDWLRHSTPVNIEENIEELTKLEKGYLIYILYHEQVFICCSIIFTLSLIVFRVNCGIQGHQSKGNQVQHYRKAYCIAFGELLLCLMYMFHILIMHASELVMVQLVSFFIIGLHTCSIPKSWII